MKNFLSTLWTAVIVFWHVALFITGIAVLAICLAASSLARALGRVPPMIVAALPEKYHPVLLKVAAFTVKFGSKDRY